VNFWRFQAAIHILTVNSTEIVQDRPGQPVYEMFGIKRRFRRFKIQRPRFKESSVRVHQIWLPPSKRAVYVTVDKSIARERLQIDTDLLRIITSTGDELSGGTNIDDFERP